MPSFNFRLETLLKLREQLRDQCHARLLQAEEAEEVLQTQSLELKQQLDETGQQTIAAASPGEINLDSLVEFRRFGMLLQAQLHQLGEQRKLIADEVARRRGELTDADRELKVLEKLKDRRLDEHHRQEHYAEIKQLDEIAQRSGSPKGAAS